MTRIYRATQVIKGEKVYKFDGLYWVFDCPVCEYVKTAIDRATAEVLEDMHYKAAASVHLDLIALRNWEDSPLSTL